MEMMNIALPKSLKEFAQQRVAEAGYSSVSEYVRELIRADQQSAQKERLEAEILKGLASSESVPMTAQDWNSLRATIRDRHLTQERS